MLNNYRVTGIDRKSDNWTHSHSCNNVTQLDTAPLLSLMINGDAGKTRTHPTPSNFSDKTIILMSQEIFPHR